MGIPGNLERHRSVFWILHTSIPMGQQALPSSAIPNLRFAVSPILPFTADVDSQPNASPSISLIPHDLRRVSHARSTRGLVAIWTVGGVRRAIRLDPDVPVQRSIAPVQSSAAPVQCLNVPVHCLDVPVQSSIAPVQSAVAPVHWPIAPVQRSIAPYKASLHRGNALFHQYKAPLYRCIALMYRCIALLYRCKTRLYRCNTALLRCNTALLRCNEASSSTGGKVVRMKLARRGSGGAKKGRGRSHALSDEAMDSSSYSAGVSGAGAMGVSS
jgi:hypothetical protein